MKSKQVCPIIYQKTDTEVRQMVSRAILPMALNLGLDRLALNLGVNEKTVRRARDQEGTVTAQNFVNLFLQSADLRAALLAECGERPVAIEAAGCAISALHPTTRAISEIAGAMAENSDGGIAVTDHELLSMESELTAAHVALGAALGRIAEVKKLRRAAA